MFLIYTLELVLAYPFSFIFPTLLYTFIFIRFSWHLHKLFYILISLTIAQILILKYMSSKIIRNKKQLNKIKRFSWTHGTSCGCLHTNSWNFPFSHNTWNKKRNCNSSRTCDSPIKSAPCMQSISISCFSPVGAKIWLPSDGQVYGCAKWSQFWGARNNTFGLKIIIKITLLEVLTIHTIEIDPYNGVLIARKAPDIINLEPIAKHGYL